MADAGAGRLGGAPEDGRRALVRAARGARRAGAA